MGEIKDQSYMKERIIKKCLYKKEGDSVGFFDNAAKALGIIFMKFSSQEEMNEVLSHINDYYEVVVDGEA